MKENFAVGWLLLMLAACAPVLAQPGMWASQSASAAEPEFPPEDYSPYRNQRAPAPTILPDPPLSGLPPSYVPQPYQIPLGTPAYPGQRSLYPGYYGRSYPGYGQWPNTGAYPAPTMPFYGGALMPGTYPGPMFSPLWSTPLGW